MANFDGPIPGQSLTMEQGNSPWEQPPLHADVQDALAWHLEKFENGDILEDTLFLLSQGFPLDTFVDSLTTTAVMEGYHTVDTSILISPVIHEYLKRLAKNANIELVEFNGPTEEEKQKKKQKDRLVMMMDKALEESGGESDLISSLEKSVAGPNVEAAQQPAPSFPDPVEPVDTTPAGKGMGLVPRRM